MFYLQGLARLRPMPNPPAIKQGLRGPIDHGCVSPGRCRGFTAIPIFRILPSYPTPLVDANYVTQSRYTGNKKNPANWEFAGLVAEENFMISI